MADADLQALEHWVDPLLTRLAPAERRRLTQRLAKELRSRQAARIAEQQNPDGTPFAPRKKRPGVASQAGRIARRAGMFQQLRQARHLISRADDTSAGVGFTGRDARIARVHQLGETDRVASNGPLFRYPARQLLGFSADDRDWALERVREWLAE